MANTEIGKKYEQAFYRDWSESVPDSMCYRLYDTTMGYKGVANTGDFICYKHPTCWIIDCKTTEGNTLPFSDIRQYDKMVELMGITGLNIGVMWWSRKNWKVIWIPIETLKKLKDEDAKSYNIKYLGDDTYPAIEIPSTRLRTFMRSDYSILFKN